MRKNELFSVLFTLALLFVLFFVFESVLGVLCISALIALLGLPIRLWFQKISFKKIQVGKGLATFLTLGVFYFIAALLLMLLFPVLANELQNISRINPNHFLEAAKGPLDFANKFIAKYSQEEFSAEDYLKEKIVNLLDFSTVSSGIAWIGNMTGNILVSIFSISFVSFFFLKDGKFFFEQFVSIFPKKYQGEIPGILNKIKAKLSRYVLGILVQVVVLFSILSLGLYLVGLENFLFIAFVGALFNIVPYIGPLIAIFFALILSTVSMCSGTPNCMVLVGPMLLKVLLVYGIAQALDNLVLQPLILSKSVNAHPLEIFLVVMISGNFFGITGMILAIPTYCSLKIIFWEIRKNSQFLNKIYQGE